MSGYLSQIKFLIVDDNAFCRVLTQRILTQFGALGIQQATDGADAMAALKTFAPDIIITDWKMKPVDGLELIRWLREGDDSPNSMIPIIMITGFSSILNVQQARDAGANEFLSKPISPTSLLMHVQNIIERPRIYVRSKQFFGPDRRRSRNSDDRRHAPVHTNDKRGQERRSNIGRRQNTS